MKKMIALIMAVCVLALCACGGGNSGSAGSGGSGGGSAGDTVKIGIFQPASGDNGAPGKQETLGSQYANYVTPTVDIGGKTYNVELVVVDNESSNDKAVSAASQLVSAGVSVVLGSYGSGVSIAGSDTFGNAGIPVIGVSCTNPQVTLGNDHYFRVCFLDPFQGTVLANLAVDEYSAKKAYILTKLGDDYSVGVGNYFKEAFEGLGGTCVVESFQEGNSDFTSYITTAKNEVWECPFWAATPWTPTWWPASARGRTWISTAPPSTRWAATPRLTRASPSTWRRTPPPWPTTAATPPSRPAPCWAMTPTMPPWRP